MRTIRYLARLLREFGAYAWEYRAWWVLPVVGLLMLFGIMALVGGAALTSLYTLF